MSTAPAARPVALVTGASAGIGAELARLLAPDHDLVLTARRTEPLQALAAELTRTHGAVCRVLPADLSEPGAARHLFEAVRAAGGGIEVLVNNAGFGDIGAFAGADPGKLLRMVQVNVTALTELTALFLPELVARGRGRVLNVGSVAGFQPGPFMAVYYATKAYVNSFSEALHSELLGTGVTVTALCPGPVATEFLTVAGAATGGFSAGQALSARAVAEVGLRAMKAGRRMVVPGWRNRMLLFLERFAPRGIVIRAVKLMLWRRAG
ncbi:Sulfoacetaldehyde reductase [Gemmata obscuriglobus]|uniref:SDR family NAD(P)-dependent oxidoreductase n=1 Tax=Gemmata obscuriglobus TaxID=114 RepID=A0A2Z3H5V3_9BACT|nr:SDR family oxidoreductase [Gemmata obscuriglobus]AWM36330.1 SDR family NAD(P)-dependent oxidoreductase [Gemmata obscuriglobus]QEG31058.1 Sulfoacetaldehyde reductase [Gemmata obscuriglobus]VTS10395.1 short-chain dehydrogenase : Short-chain dehydrogenase/reductase SDR OS=Haloferax larsenii JCM 13917 GN=C455_07747 PE=3 SV=1: adh_short [Gemmata obscuriglobus UQM 2246]